MSPVFLRRFRAERMLRREFESLRRRVLEAVRGRLRAAGIELDRGDLEAAYALAWQGLYAATLEGREIESPSSWLILVTYRRAIEEHRVQRRAGPRPGRAPAPGSPGEPPALDEDDLAEELDLRIRLGQLLEGLSGRLSERERQAATLCYLQGLSRAEAASEMGISEGRMRKLMEGRGPGQPGVSAKLGELTRTIEDGGWCESQGSLMRALAYGILARDGERYRLALSHHRRCPSCRAYVLSLRGLAGALPPTLLPGARLALAGLSGGAGRLPGAAKLARRARGGPGASHGAAGAAGASGAGGGLALSGPLGAKLAVGCLMALGVGAGCVGLEAAHAPSHGHRDAPSSALRAEGRVAGRATGHGVAVIAAGVVRRGAPVVAASSATASAASREFGPERALAAAAATPPSIQPVRAHAAVRSAPKAATEGPVATVAGAGGAVATAAASREFAP